MGRCSGGPKMAQAQIVAVRAVVAVAVAVGAVTRKDFCDGGFKRVGGAGK